jgi:hypothetical protein
VVALMRWLIAIVIAAAVGSIAYSLGAGPEFVYILRSIARHLVNSSGLVVLP